MKSGSGAISRAGADMKRNRNNKHISYYKQTIEKTEMITVWNEDVWKKKITNKVKYAT